MQKFAQNCLFSTTFTNIVVCVRVSLFVHSPTFSNQLDWIWWIVFFGAVLWIHDNTVFVWFQTRADQMLAMHRNHAVSRWISDRNVNKLKRCGRNTNATTFFEKTYVDTTMTMNTRCWKFWFVHLYQLKTAKLSQNKTIFPGIIS